MQSLVAHFRGPNVRVWSYGPSKPFEKRARHISHRRLGTLWALLVEGRGARILDSSHFHFEYPNPLLLFIWIVMKWLLRFEWYKNVADGSLPKRYPKFSAWRRWLFRRAANSIDKFMVVNAELGRWLREEIKVKQAIEAAPALFPTPFSEHSQPLAPDVAKFLEPYLSADKRVCSIGVFYPSYGFGDVALAVEQLRERTGKNIGLLLLDGGFVCDEKYRDEVLFDRDWITVLTEVANAEIYELLRRSDVFVRAFADESYGLSRIEAIWCGVPVIATRAGETRGMLLYDAGDVEQLTTQLQAVLLYPVLEDKNPWAEMYKREAEENLKILGKALGIEESGA
jgi:glycosyltransferase involved in cell wall biosynthesis